MKSVVAAAVAAVSLCHPADARPYVDDCSSSLSKQWQEELPAHPIDPSKHIVVLSIDVPVDGPETNYRQAIDRLKQAFPSFEEGFGSGILLGCCAVPVWGAVSLDDLARLSKTRFVPLCDLGRRSSSTSVGLRVEYREAYERRVGAPGYFYVFWHGKINS